MQHKPLKRFGQNFLIQPTIARKIVTALNISGEDCVIEIGPGRGVLTDIIAKENLNQFYAIEIDKNLAEQLKKRFPTRVHIIEMDFMEWDIHSAAKDKRVKIIGNIPYNITSPILFKMIDQFWLIESAVIMTQKEVAKRIVAGTGTKDYGILSIMMQTFAKVEYLFDAGAGNFNPRPKVDSAVVKFNFFNAIKGVDNIELYRKLIRSVFNFRRKMLRNTLSRIFEKTVVSSLSSFDLSKRPEQLTIQEFKLMANTINSLLK